MNPDMLTGSWDPNSSLSCTSVSSLDIEVGLKRPATGAASQLQNEDEARVWMLAAFNLMKLKGLSLCHIFLFVLYYKSVEWIHFVSESISNLMKSCSIYSTKTLACFVLLIEL